MDRRKLTNASDRQDLLVSIVDEYYFGSIYVNFQQLGPIPIALKKKINE
jgi:hypothetical protein